MEKENARTISRAGAPHSLKSNLLRGRGSESLERTLFVPTEYFAAESFAKRHFFHDHDFSGQNFICRDARTRYRNQVPDGKIGESCCRRAFSKRRRRIRIDRQGRRARLCPFGQSER